MKILRAGNFMEYTEEVLCHQCNSLLAVNRSEWKKGDYGSEEYVNCILCKAEITRPGTEYTGDF